MAQFVDFRAARRLIDGDRSVSAEVRQRAFWAWVGLFDLADDRLSIEMSAEALGEHFEVTRVTWIGYRDVLIRVGLVECGPVRGPHPQVLHLLPWATT